MSLLKLKSASAHSVQCVRKLRIFHPQFSDTCVDDETVQRTDVDHYLYRLMLFSPVRIFSGHITHATIRLLVTVHVNTTKQKSPSTTGQWRLTLTVSQSEGSTGFIGPIRCEMEPTEFLISHVIKLLPMLLSCLNLGLQQQVSLTSPISTE